MATQTRMPLDHDGRSHDNPNSTTTNDDTRRLIAQMQSCDAVYDPNHYHSFQAVSFLLLPVHSCAGCGERLATSLWGSTRPLQCAACGSYSHRSCAFSTKLQWNEKCRVNFEKYSTADDKKPIDEPNNEDRKRNVPEEEVSIATNDPPISTSSDHVLEDTLKVIRKEASSIFRSARQTSLLDSHDSDSSSLQFSKSEDGILDGRPRLHRNLDIRNTKANFPFLSASELFHKNNPSSEMESKSDPGNAVGIMTGPIQRSSTWNEFSPCQFSRKSTQTFTGCSESNSSPINSVCRPPEAKHDFSTDCDEFLWTNSGPRPHWSDASTIEEITLQVQQLREVVRHRGSDDAGPLHFASGFRVVSQALQENIIASFGRLVSKEERPDSKTVSLDSVPQHYDQGVATDDDSNEKENVHRLLDETRPTQDILADKKRLGIGYIAGGVAGGLAGLVLAGPAGGLIGIKFGQLGALGMLLEGSFAVGALAGGVAAGQNIGKHLDHRIEQSRVLALGDGTNRQVLLLIRPSIQPPDEAWSLIYGEAWRTYPGSGGGFVQRLIPNETQAAKRERYEREVDIVEVAESELPTSDKVLLLVSRLLNNKESLPGHVYRHLIDAFRKRATRDDDDLKSVACLMHKEQNLHHSMHGTTAQDNREVDKDHLHDDYEERINATSTRRRQDTHAIIKYITAALLETRPGFGCSPGITEMTATAVESLVFGEIYDMVMAEIMREKEALDDSLVTKIHTFELRQQLKRSHGCAEAHSTQRSFKGTVSDKALIALHCLPEAHSAVDKLRYCVLFLEEISGHFTAATLQELGADSLLPMVCHHIIAAKVPGINAEVSFLEEFARDEQLLRGKEGYALVTLQAALHYLNSSDDYESDIFCNEEDSGDME